MNIFHGRAEDPRHGGIYVRPHTRRHRASPGGAGTVSARVQRVHGAGPTVKIELVTDLGDLVQAEISQEQQRRLVLSREDRVYVRPMESRAFGEDYSI